MGIGTYKGCPGLLIIRELLFVVVSRFDFVTYVLVFPIKRRHLNEDVLTDDLDLSVDGVVGKSVR